MSLTLKYFIFTTYRIIYTRFILHTVTNQQQSTIHLKKNQIISQIGKNFGITKKSCTFALKNRDKFRLDLIILVRVRKDRTANKILGCTRKGAWGADGGDGKPPLYVFSHWFITNPQISKLTYSHLY